MTPCMNSILCTLRMNSATYTPCMNSAIYVYMEWREPLTGPWGLIYRGQEGTITFLPPRCERDRRERKGRMGTCLLEYAIQTRFTYAQCHRHHTGIPDDPRVLGTSWCSATTTPSSAWSEVARTVPAVQRGERTYPCRPRPLGSREYFGETSARRHRARTSALTSRRAAKFRRCSEGEVGAEPPRRGMGLEASGEVCAEPPRRGFGLEAGGEAPEALRR